MDPLYGSAVLVRAARPDDAEPVRHIRNHAVETTTALWTTETLDPEQGVAWLAPYLADRSVLVAELDGRVVGYACWGPFRPKEGYRFTVENSVYVAPDAQGRGVGRALLTALVAAAREAGLHAMVAAIDAGNEGSVRLHTSLGFVHEGTLREVGTKFGRWLDLALLRLPLSHGAPRD